MNIKLFPNSGSGFVICKGQKAVTENNPEGSFIVPIVHVNDSYAAFERGEQIIKKANGSESKYFRNGDSMKIQATAPIPISPVRPANFFPKKIKRRDTSALSYAR